MQHRIGDSWCECVSCRVYRKEHAPILRRPWTVTFLWVSIVWTIALSLKCING
jgi:hypothetical protein